MRKPGALRVRPAELRATVRTGSGPLVSTYRGNRVTVFPGWGCSDLALEGSGERAVLAAHFSAARPRVRPGVWLAPAGRARGLRGAAAEGGVDGLDAYPRRLRLGHAEPFEDVQRLPQ